MASENESASDAGTRARKRVRTDSNPAPPAAEKKPTPEASADAEDDSSSDDDIGPTLPPAGGAVTKKKRRTLPHEKLYLAALPTAPRYSKSLMHRDHLAFVTMTPFTDFLITTSVDGVVKFWKKMAVGIEFVKMFRAHQGEIVGVAVSTDGRSFASAGVDGRVAIFDVVTFDLLTTITLPNAPKAICWVHRRGSSLPLLAVSDVVSPHIVIYDGRGDNPKVLYTVEHMHRSIVHLMAFNDKYNCVVSCDESGMVEYWSPRPEREFEKPDNVFEYKSNTGLFEFKRAKSVPTSLTISPTHESFATFSHPDRQIRIFDFPSARLTRTYDESVSTLTTMQQAAPAATKLPDIEFGRRIALETDLSSPATTSATPPTPLTTTHLSKANIVFDESGHFILYGSLAGIKVLNTTTNTVVRTLGKEEPLRPLNIALYQGAPNKKDLVTVEMAASANPLLSEAESRDPMLFCTAAAKPRFYIFTNDASASKTDRDILNEKPLLSAGAAAGAAGADAAPKESGKAAVIHTSMGDIHVRLFPEAAPRTVENFVTHARNGYYNGTIFHRVIRKFMIQGGDPCGDGTGGESIWGGEFEDEFSTLRHDKPYTLSMANAGPNTNGSQFFITTEKTPWLDGKHTIFGRTIQGLDVVNKIENVRTFKEKPEEDVKIINISVL
ncbi:uncharacterized protein H6S33_010604 [Morchella sextelata]|uniref:uncharacterized protein n=1 Tax=Morchella sextelata TaxID=1174677 RepID=UPI001D04FED7|nr:uncharacterized protein H6S33_010604 [Morchella sextelata]KAH0611339.1 hypothetical protein H6S33_010604 [Morchella sextelata]